MHPESPTIPPAQPPEWASIVLAAIEQAPWPMAAVEGPNHVVRQINAAFCHLLDRPRGDLVGQLCAEVIPDNPEWLTLLDRVSRTGQAESHAEGEHSGRSSLFRSATLWPMQAEGRPAGVMIQVTDTATGYARMVAMNEALVLGAVRQDELIEEAEHARVEAVAANLAKDRFLAVLSHELRTPLTPVVMAVHMLTHGKKSPGQLANSLAMIERNVQIELRLINDLLDFSSISHGKLAVLCERIDVHEVLRHAVEGVTHEIEGKHQRLTFALEASKHTMLGDGVRLRQVFSNLLKNASKFTPDNGEIHVRSRHEPASPPAVGRIVVEVSDTGIGFSPEMSEHLFDAFAQASEAIMREYGGLGLGLAISRSLVDAHQGTLRAHSAGAGSGATFTVELPLSGQDIPLHASFARVPEEIT